MLRWAYTDELALSEDDAFLIDLMKLSNRFQLQLLRERWALSPCCLSLLTLGYTQPGRALSIIFLSIFKSMAPTMFHDPPQPPGMDPGLSV